MIDGEECFQCFTTPSCLTFYFAVRKISSVDGTSAPASESGAADVSEDIWGRDAA